MPAALTKPSTGELIIKSPVLPVARIPQNEVIVLLYGMVETVSFASFIILTIPPLTKDIPVASVPRTDECSARALVRLDNPLIALLL